VLEAFQVQPGADLLDQVGGDPAPLRRRVEADPVQPVAEGVGDPERLLGLVLERVDQDDPGDVRLEVAVERLGGRTVSPKTRTSEWGIVPVGLRPARRAPAGVDAPTQPPTIAA
jgi:hypothetical protein